MEATARGVRRAVMLAVIVTGLLFGLVAMHHASAAGSPGIMSTSASEPMLIAMPDAVTEHQLGDPGGAAHAGAGHGGEDGSALLHLCLAILTAVVLILTGTHKWRWVLARSARSAVAVIRPASRPCAPPSSAPARLALLCVLRT